MSYASDVTVYSKILSDQYVKKWSTAVCHKLWDYNALWLEHYNRVCDSVR